jgi:thiol-disulfide isomerase/thioredoxin
MSSSPRPAPALLLAAGLSGLLVATLPMRVFALPAGGGGSTTPTIGEALKPSSAEQIAVADWLRQRGVIFYGAWWCPACFQQKNLFGKEAGNRLPYVECDKEETGRQRCAAADVRVFPTWVLEGNRLEGVQTVEELKRWGGFPAKALVSP